MAPIQPKNLTLPPARAALSAPSFDDFDRHAMPRRCRGDEPEVCVANDILGSDDQWPRIEQVVDRFHRDIDGELGESDFREALLPGVPLLDCYRSDLVDVLIPACRSARGDDHQWMREGLVRDIATWMAGVLVGNWRERQWSQKLEADARGIVMLLPGRDGGAPSVALRGCLFANRPTSLAGRG